MQDAWQYRRSAKLDASSGGMTRSQGLEPWTGPGKILRGIQLVRRRHEVQRPLASLGTGSADGLWGTASYYMAWSTVNKHKY